MVHPVRVRRQRKGHTRISIAKAKEIAAELRASVAEAELRLVRAALVDEQTRCAELCRQYSEASDARHAAQSELAELRRKMRGRGRKAAERRSTSPFASSPERLCPGGRRGQLTTR